MPAVTIAPLPQGATMPITAGSLSAFLSPRSVAVVGASDRATSSGGAVLHNLLKSGYRGRVVPVNPKGGDLLGLPVASTLREIAPACDLAVVVVRPDGILDVVREAAASGHRNLLILPGGFAEGGDEGKARDRELRALAAQHGLTLAGPNCAGLINLLEARAPFAATFFRDLPRGGGVALVSQSGAIAEEVIASSHTLGIPLGAVVSVGNAMQLGLPEYLEHLGADPACSVVLLYAESFGDAARFNALAREVSRSQAGGRVDRRSHRPRARCGAQTHRLAGDDRRGGRSVLPRRENGARHQPARPDAGGQGLRGSAARHRAPRADSFELGRARRAVQRPLRRREPAHPRAARRAAGAPAQLPAARGGRGQPAGSSRRRARGSLRRDAARRSCEEGGDGFDAIS